MKVAIVGASGIGRYHAQWFHKEGCDVAAYVGRTPESVQIADRLLKKIFKFEGRGYTRIQEMLQKEEPDLVAICTPPETHYEFAATALNAGAHVFCEKPLVWGKNSTQIINEGRQLIEIARKNDHLIGINTQYVAAIPWYETLRRQIKGERSEFLTSFYFEMESQGSHGRVHYEDLLIEIASHPLSMLLAWLPEGHMMQEGIKCDVAHKEARAHFGYQHAKGICNVEIVCRHVGTTTLLRRFGTNGFIVDCFGKKDEQQFFKTYLRYGKDEIACEDFMQQSIRHFIQAAEKNDPRLMLTSGEQGYRNLVMQEQLHQHAKRRE